MPEPTSQVTPPDTSKTDLTNYVPKSELEKTTETHKKELAALKSKLDETTLALLDPEYISWKEDKESKPKPGPK